MRVSVVPWVLLQALGAVVGLAHMTTARFDTSTLVAEYIFLNCAFLAGYLLYGQHEAAVTPHRALPRLELRQPRRLVPVVAVVCGLALFHVAATNPLFQGPESIEVSRFDFTSSGLLGVPGRMFLFGVPLVWILATAVAAKLALPPWRSLPWQIATATYIVTSLGAGFKSGLLTMLATMALTSAAIYSYRGSGFRLLGRFWPLLAGAVVYAAAVATLYPSYSRSGDGVLSAFFSRVTDVSAEPKALVLTGGIAGVSDPAILSDFSYFVPRYLGGGDPLDFSTEQAVSAALLGLPPTTSDFLTPVTMGGFPELQLSFGLVIGSAIIFVLGAALRYLEAGPRDWALGSFLRGAAIFGLSLWIVRGNLAYYVLNLIFVVVFIAGLVFLFCGVRREWSVGAKLPGVAVAPHPPRSSRATR